jgi:transcriptional regulator GlxA family with amidase domain
MSRRREKARLRSVAVIAFGRISAFQLSVPCLVFGEDRSELGVPACELRVCAAESGKLRTTGGFDIEAWHALWLRQHFAHTLALSPSQYRRQFRH